MRLSRTFVQIAVISATVVAFASLLPRRANAAELVMLEQKGCIWCDMWHSQIGHIYPKTNEGKVAPLREIDIDGNIPSDLAGIHIDRLTPTFILMDNGVEIDRLRGYPGDEFFWFLLDKMLEKLPESS
jgi:thioredoxin-related protein